LDNQVFGEHYHCISFAGQCSTVAGVKASIIQGSALGPAARCHCRRFASSRRNESFVQHADEWWHLWRRAGGHFKVVQHRDVTRWVTGSY